MEEVLREEIGNFVLASPDNRFSDSEQPYFDQPLVGFATAADPLFKAFKHIIGEFHLTPGEVLQHACGCSVEEARTVICWILPITEATRQSNRQAQKVPSREWAMTRAHGEAFNTLLRIHLIKLIRSLGARAVAPSFPVCGDR